MISKVTERTFYERAIIEMARHPAALQIPRDQREAEARDLARRWAAELAEHVVEMGLRMG